MIDEKRVYLYDPTTFMDKELKVLNNSITQNLKTNFIQYMKKNHHKIQQKHHKSKIVI